ncbi:NADase-type glycan-binding domain-containing protein [Streptomyces sp. NPDC052040]|uniref:NADase-type glycan-binding domain-containing protein n=1 Tax=unclassified Streptomyces TaxID=2593676 RepID=UPI0037D3A00B
MSPGNGHAEPPQQELYWVDPLFAPLPTGPAPHTARPQPGGRLPEFGWADPYPGCTGAFGTGPAAGRPQIISGEVVLGTAPADDGVHGSDAPVPPDGEPYLLECPACGGPNTDSRTYCHPCGALLRPEPDEEPPPPTRWERLRERYADRPEVWHWDRRWGVVLGALPLCFVAAASMGGAVAAAPGAVPTIKDRFLSQYAVRPDAVDASSSAKGFEPELAADGVDNRAWAPQNSGEDAIGQYWTAAFNSPFRLTSLLVINGAAKAPRQFAETGRPTRIKVTATTGRGMVEKEIELGGQPGPQRFDLGIDDVTQVRVTIMAVNRGLKPDMPVAMAEIQFFSRQGS